jgi:hypothetical protein
MIFNKPCFLALLNCIFLTLQAGCLPMLDAGPRTRGTWTGVSTPATLLDATGTTHPGWILEVTDGPGIHDVESAAGFRALLTDRDAVLLQHRLLRSGARLRVSGTMRNLTVRASPSGPQVAPELGSSGGVPMAFVIMAGSIRAE